MAGAMRKMGIYLGLVEDERRAELAEYEEYDEYAEAEVVPAHRERYSRGWDDADARPLPAHDGGGYREPVYRETPDEPAYRITTLHPRTYNEARTIGQHFRDGTALMERPLGEVVVHLGPEARPLHPGALSPNGGSPLGREAADAAAERA